MCTQLHLYRCVTCICDLMVFDVSHNSWNFLNKTNLDLLKASGMFPQVCSCAYKKGLMTADAI